MVVAWGHALIAAYTRGYMTTQRHQTGWTQTHRELLGSRGSHCVLGTHELLPRQLSHVLWKSWHLEDMQSHSSRVHPVNVLAHVTASSLGIPAAGSQPCIRAAGLMESPSPGGAVSSWLYFIEQEEFIFSKQCQLERDCSMAASQWRATAAGTALKDPICGGILLGGGS